MNLRVTEWSYQSEPGAVRHIGPMAQDFYAAFGLGADDRHITAIDADGVALAAIQQLHRMLVDEMRAKEVALSAMERRVAELQEAVDRLHDAR